MSRSQPFAAPTEGERVLVSACLLGGRCRYDAEVRRNAEVSSWPEERRVAVCPEELGGLGTPRPPASIDAGAAGGDVLEGRAKVTTDVGTDVSREFVRGAERALELGLAAGCRRAFLKSRSPSCGYRELSGRLEAANGVFSELLERQGFEITAVDFDG